MAQAAAYAAYPSANRPLIAATLAANLARYRLEPQ
jgi:hypothetical protein